LFSDTLRRYVGPGKVEVASIADAQLVEPSGRKANHGVIIKTLATNICGSDQHMVTALSSPPRNISIAP
jgi:glutathione-independent formaldehyde dehydrogenase